MAKTECNIWKGVLLEWVNATGFLVRNYENLTDTDIEDFYRGFKNQMKTTKIKSIDAVQFLKDYYPEFEFELEINESNLDNEIPSKEFIFVYSLFMHFSCVRYPDINIQQICSNLTEKFQEHIKIFLNNVVKYTRFPRNLLQDAIEDVESLDVLNSSISSTKSGPSILKSDSQQTPRTARYLNERHVEAMNLKAMLETERYERGYLEMQAKHNEEKLSKLDAEYKKASATINELNKQIANLRDEIEASERNGVDRVIRDLRKQIQEKDDKIEDCIMDMNALKDSNSLLEEKIKYAEKQIKNLSNDKAILYNDMDQFKIELDERDKNILCINNRNKELEDMIREMRTDASPNKKLYESSFDFLNASTSSTVESSFSFPSEENMANAVVDVRLLDQQKQNQELTETLNDLNGKLTKLQLEANDVYVELSHSIGLSVDSLPDLDTILSESMNLMREILKKSAEANSLLDSKKEEFEKVTAMRDTLQENIEENEKSIETLNSQITELKTSLNAAQNKYEKFVDETQEKNKKTEEKIQSLETTLNDVERKNEVDTERFTSIIDKLEKQIKIAADEKDELISCLTESQNEINSLNQILNQRSKEVDQLQNEKSAVNDELEITVKMLEEARQTVKASEKQLEKMSNDKNDFYEKLQNAHEKIYQLEKLNDDIVEFKQVIENLNSSVSSYQSTITELESKNESLERALAQFNEKCEELEKDNLNLAKARVKAEDEINVSYERITKQSDIINEHKKTIEELQIVAEEKVKLDEKLSQMDISFKEIELSLQMKIETILKLEQENEIIESNLKNEIAARADENSKYQENIKTNQKNFETQLNERNEKIGELKSQIDKEIETLLLRTEQIESLSKELEILRETNQCLIDSEKTLKSLLDTNKSDHELKNVEIVNQKVQLESLGKTKNELIENVKNNEIIRQSLKLEITELTEKARKLEESERQIADLNMEIKQNQKELLGLQTALKNTETRRNSIQNELDALNQENSTIKTANHSLQTKIDELQTEIVELKASNEKCSLQLSETEKEISELKKNIEIKINEFNTKEMEYVSKIEDTNRSLAELVDNLKVQKIEMEVLTAEKTKLEDRISNLIEEQNLNEQKLQAEQEKLSSEKNNFEKQDEERKTEIEELKLKISFLNSELEAERTKYFSEIAEMQNVIGAKETLLKEETIKFTSEIQNLEEKLTSITIELNDIKTQKIEVEQELNAKLQATNEEIVKQSTLKNELEQKIISINSEISSSKGSNEKLKEEISIITSEKNALVTKVIELNHTIDEQQQLQTKYETESKDLLQQIIELKDELKVMKKTTEKSNYKIAENQKEINELNEKLTSSSEQIASLECSSNQLKEELVALQEQNSKLIESTSNKDQLNILKAQSTQIQKKYNEAAERWEDEKKSLIQDMKILRAKLTKERDTISTKDKEHETKVTEVRHEFEEKLEKMKEKMKTLYSEEMSKVKAKHEHELNEISMEKQRYANKVSQFENRFEQSATQLHNMNTRYLELLKDSEIMKSKLRNYENSASFQSINPSSSNVPPNFMENIRVGNGFKMEDEEGELFDNTYLDQMKSEGRFSMSGRDSLTFDEIQRRNSMVPPHLRSSYSVQYQNSNLNENDSKNNDDHRASSIDISMISTTSDQKRGTLYKRPGPPTPSKNGGRLSLGGTTSELPKGEILRESNTNRDNIPSSAKSSGKKSTPGKFRSIFSSAKIKDENVSTPTLKLKLGDCLKSSTPRRRFSNFGDKELASMDSISMLERSLSILRTTNVYTCDSTELNSTVELTSPNSDSPQNQSKSEFFSGKRRKSNCAKRRKSGVIKNQKRQWKEKRLREFTKGRQLSIGHSDAFKHSFKIPNATFSIIELKTQKLLNETELEKEEIDAFHHEIDFHPSKLELIDEFIDDDINFERLCNEKESDHPYGDRNVVIALKKSINKEPPSITSETQVLSESNNKEYNDTPASLCSTVSTTINRTYQSSTLDLNRHKMPRIIKYKSQTQINQNFSETTDDLNFGKLPLRYQRFIIASGVGFIAVLISFFLYLYFYFCSTQRLNIV